MWDPEVVSLIYHFTTFSTEFLGPKSYRHPGPPPPPPTVVWWGYLLPQGDLSCDIWGRWRVDVYALDHRFWGPVVAGVERDNPPTRVGFDSQWTLPMSCCFRMFCSSSLGILNQATQEVLSGRVGSLFAPSPALMPLAL